MKWILKKWILWLVRYYAMWWTVFVSICLTVMITIYLYEAMFYKIDYNIIPIQSIALWLDGVWCSSVWLVYVFRVNTTAGSQQQPAAASSAESISVIGSEAADSLQHFMAVIIHSEHWPLYHQPVAYNLQLTIWQQCYSLDFRLGDVHGTTKIKDLL